MDNYGQSDPRTSVAVLSALVDRIDSERGSDGEWPSGVAALLDGVVQAVDALSSPRQQEGE